MRLIPAAALLGSLGCTDAPAASNRAPRPAPDPAAPVLVGAGDIAYCGRDVDEETAKLLDSIPGTVFTVGDHVYPDASEERFAECYGASWGRHRSRTRPAAGNHEYHIAGAGPYFAYFGERAGEAGKGWYSYDLGAWHIVVLNSNLDLRDGSEQLRWLEGDLRASGARCTLAYWHHPRFGSTGPRDALLDAWRVLYRAGVDVVLNGHDHQYQRFAPQTPEGEADPVRGIRQFTVGTGGGGLQSFKGKSLNSEARGRHYGVLALTLGDSRYDWRFVPIAGSSFSDAGTGSCH